MLLTSLAFADDWPQHLGPNRNGISAEQGLIADIPDSGLNVLWQVSGGVGMSGVAVADGTAITIVQRDNSFTGRVTLAFEDAPLRLAKWQIKDPQGNIADVMLQEPRFNIKVDERLFSLLDPTSDMPDEKRE